MRISPAFGWGRRTIYHEAYKGLPFFGKLLRKNGDPVTCSLWLPTCQQSVCSASDVLDGMKENYVCLENVVPYLYLGLSLGISMA